MSKQKKLEEEGKDIIEEQFKKFKEDELDIFEEGN